MQTKRQKINQKRQLKAKNKRKAFNKFKREYKPKKVILDVKHHPKPSFWQKVTAYIMIVILLGQRVYFEIRLWLSNKKASKKS